MTLPPGLSSESLEALSLVLADLVSSDNAVRSKGEARLNADLESNAPSTLMALSYLMAQHPEEQFRSFAAVLVRRMALKTPASSQGQHVLQQGPPFWINMGEDARTISEGLILQALKKEPIVRVRRQISDTAAEIAKYMISQGSTWMELLHLVLESAHQSSPADTREGGFRVISSCPELIWDQDATAIISLFMSGLADPSANVKQSALKAAVTFMVNSDTDISQHDYGQLVPHMLMVLPLLVESDETGLVNALGSLIELAECHAKLFRSVLSQLVQFICNVMRNENLQSSTRQSGLELLLTLSEAAAGMIRKNGTLAPAIIPILLEWMSTLDDDEEWYTTNDIEDEDNDADSVMAWQAMDRIARALGGKSILPVTFALLPKMLGSPEWAQRHAALIAISAIAEGCVKIMKSELGEIMKMILPFLRDPHPRVRYAACHCIGQMCTDFANILQSQYHEPILSNLVPAMDDAAFPRVQAHAAAALVNFADDAKAEYLLPSLESILQRLLQLLSTGKIYVQEQAVTTMATIADRVQDAFQPYYASVMPLLFNIMESATQKEFRLLRGKAMECATLIAIAVGKTTFAGDAARLMAIIQTVQASVEDADDPQMSYLLAASTRVCKVLGHDFLPFMESVMPPLLRTAQIKPNYAFVDIDEDTSSAYPEEEGWEFVVVDGKKVGIHTAALEEKCTAVQMFACYAAELGAGFQPFVEPVMAIVVPLLDFYFHEGVREAAAATIPALFQCLQRAQCDRTALLAAWHSVAAKIIASIMSEGDPAFLYHLFECFYSSLEHIGAKAMTPELMDTFSKATLSQLGEYFNRMEERQDSRKDADYDEEVEEALVEAEGNDEEFLSELSRAVHEVFKSERADFLPYFDPFIPVVAKFLASSDSRGRQWALCVLDDVIEFTGPLSIRYQSVFAQPMLASLRDASPELRQAGAYGIGLCAHYGGAEFKTFCQSALHALADMIGAPDAKSEANVLATENAISALGKIMRYFALAEDMLPFWLNALPILQDDEEAPHTYTYLLDLIDSNHPAVLGDHGANVPKLINIFTAAEQNGMIVDALLVRAFTTVQRLIASLDVEGKRSLVSALSPYALQVVTKRGLLA